MELSEIKRLSKALFGNAYTISVSALIARSDGIVTAQQLARRLNVDSNLVRPVLTRLVSAELLKQLPKFGQEHPLERQPSPFWAFCLEVLGEGGE